MYANAKTQTAILHFTTKSNTKKGKGSCCFLTASYPSKQTSSSLLLLLLLHFPAISLGCTILCEIFVHVTIFHPTIEVVTLHLCGWCMLGVFVASIHLSGPWMSGSFDSVRWNACVHRLDLGLYSHEKEFWGGNGVRTHVNSKVKNPVYQKNSPQRRIEPTTLHQAEQRAQHTTNWAIPAP